MTKDENHYLNCIDENCEKVFCVDRRNRNSIDHALYTYKNAFEDIYWMARRYASGRHAYARLYNAALRQVMAVGFEPKKGDENIWADVPGGG